VKSKMKAALGLLATALAAASADVQQIHLSMRNNGSMITVTWLSTTKGATWHVGFGTATPDEVSVSAETEGTYQYNVINASDNSCYSYTSPNILKSSITPAQAKFLQPGAKVMYKITSDAGDASDTYNFLVPPTTTAPVRLALIGDLGQTVNSTRTVDHIVAGTGESNPYDAAVIVGDLSYADSENLGKCGHPGGCVPTRWDSFGVMFEALGSGLPTMTTPGNHEIELVSVGAQDQQLAEQCNVTDIPFLEYRFRWFDYETDSPNALHYSWNIGNVHNIMLNSYSRYVDDKWNTTMAAQYTWLEADLKAIDKTATPWLLVHLHAPWYNSNSHHQNEIEEWAIMALFEPLLHQYGVDVIFAGHVHAYERTHPVLNGKLATSPSYIEINIGDGGNREGPALPWCEPISLFPWSAYRDAEFGHGTFETFNSTTARWTWHRNNVSESDPPGDDIWITKSGNGVKVHDAMPEHKHLGQEWAPGRQHEHVDNPRYGRRETRRSYSACPSKWW